MTAERTAWLCHVATQSQPPYRDMREALMSCLDGLVVEVLHHWSRYPDTAGELPVGTVAYLNGLNAAAQQLVQTMADSLLRTAARTSDELDTADCR